MQERVTEIREEVEEEEEEDKRWSLQEEIAKPFDKALKHGLCIWDNNVSCSISPCFNKKYGDYTCTSILDTWPDVKKGRRFRGPTHAALNVRMRLVIQQNDMIERSLVSAPGFLHFTSREWIATSKMMMTEFLIERFPNGKVNDQAIGEPEVLYEESKKRFDEDAEFRERAQQLGRKAPTCMGANLQDKPRTLPKRISSYGVPRERRGGNTAVYLQYTHAQICSVTKKISKKIKKLKNLKVTDDEELILKNGEKLTLKNEEEHELGVHLLRFTEVLGEVSKVAMPHILCDYLYELCKKFNSLYSYVGEVVLSGEKTGEETSKLLLCEATRVVMKKCFHLLGITPIYRPPFAEPGTKSAPKFIRANLSSKLMLSDLTLNRLKMPPFAEPGTIPTPAARVPDEGALTLADFEDFEFDCGRLKVPPLESETTYFSDATEESETAYFSDATEEQLMTLFGTGSHFRFEVCKVVPRHNNDHTVYNTSGYDKLLLFGIIKAENSFLDPSNNGSFYMFNVDPDPSVYTTTRCFYMFNRNYDDSLVLTSDTIPPQEICYHSIHVFTSLKVTCKLYGAADKGRSDFKDLSEYWDHIRAQPKEKLPYPKVGQEMYYFDSDLLEFSDDNQEINFSEYFAKKPRGGFASLKLKGKNGCLELYYTALRYPVDATLEVEFFAPCKETKVAGRVMAYYGKDFYYDCDGAREDDHYAMMFETTPDGFLSPGKINLMRSVLAVPAQFSIIIVAQLREFLSEKVILSGSYEFRVPVHDPNSVGCIKGNDGVLLGLKVGWKLPL
ncbi:hypothetical protein CTI12_AA032950 [Artemisia annua]|uniref:arginine--tRNA ligase n=1 Tax=Artemisia annua TaxID=35608 RepID=A0A2U1QGB0_ARTAN|nr:hypothetical protein CTI12_AA032950 [Artemisia annua]